MTEHSPTTTDDPAQLRAQLNAALTRIADLERLLDELATTTEERERAFACLKEELLNLKRMMFGPRRERLPEAPGQGHLFDEADAPNTPPDPADDGRAADTPPKRRKGHGRRPIPDHVPRQDVPHDVPAADQMCACGRAKTKIGEDVTEQLDYVPGKMVVLRHIYPKYACPCCQDGVTTAPTAPAPIPGGLPTAGLLAFILVNKFGAHLPLYRQQDELARAGVFFPRSTLCDWVGRCGELLEPLVDLMHKAVLESRIIQGDETPVAVLDRSRDSTRKGYIWTTIGDRDHPYTTCHYTDSRSRDGPAKFLAGFQGVLQTDAYSSYESIVLGSGGKIIGAGCWAHARRDFFDARMNYPREAHYVLALVAQLYDVEDEVANRGDAERLAARQARSVPVLARLEKFLREQKETALPQSKFGQAIGYALNHWEIHD
jgi:transposase